MVKSIWKYGILTLINVLFLSSCTDNPENAAPSGGNTPAHENDIGGYAVRSANSPTVSAQDKNAANPDGHLSNGRSQNLRRPALLPSESRLISGDTVSVDAAAPILKSKNFDGFIQKMELENARDPLAQQMKDLQKKDLEERLKEANAGVLNEFTCGLSVCVGAIDVGKDLTGYRKFSADFLNSPPGISFSLIDHEVRVGDDKFEKRFIISVDPSVTGISIPNNATANNGG